MYHHNLAWFNNISWVSQMTAHPNALIPKFLQLIAVKVHEVINHFHVHVNTISL